MRKIIAVSLAILTLALSLKADIALHFCGGKLVQLKLLVADDKATCGMEEDNDNCENNSSSVKKTSCCENLLQQITTDSYQNNEKPGFYLSELTTAIVCTLTGSIGKEFEFIDSSYYKPPLNLTSVSLPIIQIFLI